MHRLDRDRRKPPRHLGRALARDGCAQPPDDLEQPRAAGVDDARFLEDGEELGRPRERLLASRDDECEEVEPFQFAGLRGLRRLGHLTDHGQHRALDRPPHGSVCGVARGSKRPRDHRLVDRIALAEHVRETADDLAEDDPRVASRTHERGTRQLPGYRLVPGGGRLLEALDDRAHRQRQVRSGVTVRHRIDVEIVDALAVRLEVGEGGAGDLAGALEVHEERLTSSIRTSTRATGSPVWRSTS